MKREEMEKLIINKLDKLQIGQGEIQTTQAVQAEHIKANKESLEEHMARTEMAEKRIETLEDKTLWSWMKVNLKTIAIAIGLFITILEVVEYWINHVITQH